jgi:hypothetical protein
MGKIILSLVGIGIVAIFVFVLGQTLDVNVMDHVGGGWGLAGTIIVPGISLGLLLSDWLE